MKKLVNPGTSRGMDAPKSNKTQWMSLAANPARAGGKRSAGHAHLYFDRLFIEGDAGGELGPLHREARLEVAHIA